MLKRVWSTRTLIHCYTNVKWFNHVQDTCTFSHNIKHTLFLHPRNSTSKYLIYKMSIKKKFYLNVYGSFILSIPKLKVNQMSINRWIDKQILAYQFNGILRSNKKGCTTKTLNNMDESQKHYAEWKKPAQKKTYYIISLTWNYRQKKCNPCWQKA